MKAQRVYKGGTARARARFTDPDTQKPVDVVEPVTFRFRRPDNSSVGPLTGAKVSQGVYDAFTAVDQAGTWIGYAISSGTYPVVVETEFTVHETTF